MKITILGSGGAGGVPLIGNNWGTCDPQEPRNSRLRASILVEEGGQTLLVDTAPDLRQQFLKADVKEVTAVLYTHAHADHTHGLDDLRAVNWLMQRPIAVYADDPTYTELERRFAYIFKKPAQDPGVFVRPGLVRHPIELGHDLSFGSVRVTPILQNHGFISSLGFRFNDFAYSTDAKELSDEAFEQLQGVKVWVVGCIHEKPHKTHAHLDLALSWIERVKPERAYLTHMDHTMDYKTLCETLPNPVQPAHDGLVIEL